MALIKCEECGKEISDKASACVHCGCPIILNNDENNIEDTYNIASIVDQYGNDRISACKYLSHTYGLSLIDSKKLIDEEHNKRKSTKVIQNSYIPPISKRQEIKQRISDNKQNAIACCPKCGSTSLSANKKGFGLLKGAAGAFAFGGYGVVTAGIGKNNVLITCINCGHSFKPSKH